MSPQNSLPTPRCILLLRNVLDQNLLWNFFLSGSLRFYLWVVLITFKTRTSSLVVFRCINLSLSHGRYEHTPMLILALRHLVEVVNILFFWNFVFREGMFMVLGNNTSGWSTLTILLRGHMQQIRYLNTLKFLEQALLQPYRFSDNVQKSGRCYQLRLAMWHIPMMLALFLPLYLFLCRLSVWWIFRVCL